MPAASIRARVRAEMIDEIKQVARRHLATDGANLSLRAVARDMGMVSSAVYRYFPSRDDLLTALIIDAYNSLGDAVAAADDPADADLRARFLGICRAVRAWALAAPAEYALIFGSPVPGYAAPADTVVAAARTPATLVGVLVAGLATGEIRADGDLPDTVRGDLTRAVQAAFPGLPPVVLARGMTAWIHLFGLVSFELFGQFNNVIEAREDFFDYQVAEVLTVIFK
jgi:AcrR family transcriptional regulator